MIVNVIPFILFICYFFLVSLIDTLSLKTTYVQRGFLLCTSLIILIIFAGCRWSSWEIGYEVDIFDYDSYKKVFQYPLSITNFFHDYANSSFRIRSMEIGYVLYSAFCRTLLGNNYNLYLLFTNFLLIILLYKSFKVNKISYCFLFLLFFYAARLYLQYNFILMRQAIAICIVWYAFHYLVKGMKKKFYLLVCLAFSFHFTAIIAFISPFFCNRNINIKKLVVYMLILFLLNITRLTDRIFIAFIDNVLSLFNRDGIGRLIKYLLLEEDGYRGLNLLTFVEASPFIYITIKYKKELLNSPTGIFFYNMFYCFLFCLVLTMNFGFLTRMNQYFIYSYFFLLSFYYAHSKIIQNKIMFSLLGGYLLVYATRYIFMWFNSTAFSCFILQ